MYLKFWVHVTSETEEMKEWKILGSQETGKHEFNNNQALLWKKNENEWK